MAVKIGLWKWLLVFVRGVVGRILPMKTYLKIDVTGLSDRHIAALEMFIAKFKAGAFEHGDLQRGKDWTPDMLGESIDLNFYQIFQLLDILEEHK